MRPTETRPGPALGLGPKPQAAAASWSRGIRHGTPGTALLPAPRGPARLRASDPAAINALRRSPLAGTPRRRAGRTRGRRRHRRPRRPEDRLGRPKTPSLRVPAKDASDSDPKPASRPLEFSLSPVPVSRVVRKPGVEEGLLTPSALGAFQHLSPSKDLTRRLTSARSSVAEAVAAGLPRSGLPEPSPARVRDFSLPRTETQWSHRYPTPLLTLGSD